MAETRNRKACDRCHDQKLSCKRVGDGDCERCSKARRPCKSSPSLRYRKHRVDHHQGGSEMASSRSRGVVMNPRPLSARDAPQHTMTSHPPYTSLAMDPSQSNYPETTFRYPNEAGSGIDYDLSNYNSPDALQSCYTSSRGAKAMVNIKDAETSAYSPEAWGGPINWSSTQIWDPIIINSAALSPQTTLSGSMDLSPIGDISGWNTTCLGPNSALVDTVSSVSHMPPPPPTTPLCNQLLEVNEQVCALMGHSLPEASSSSNNQPARTDLRSLPKTHASGFSVEKLFRLSTSFSNTIDVLGDMAESSIHSKPKAGSGGSNLATSLFILSVYTRFLDAYQLIFSLLKRGEWTSRPAEAIRAWKVPDIVVGSIPMEFTPSQQLSLTTKLASQCLATIGRAVDRLLRADDLTCFSECHGESEMARSSRIVEDTLRCIRMKEHHIRTEVLDVESMGQTQISS